MAAAETPAAPDSAGAGRGQAAEEEAGIADADRLEAFCSLPPVERPALDAALRGVLAETALHNRQRYPWRLLAPLLHRLIDSVLAEYAPPEEEEGEGPPRPPPPGFEGADSLGAHLHELLGGYQGAPFTLQRLCELLLEPRKQYARLDKVAVAVEKLLLVTSTLPDPAPVGAGLPPPPRLAELRGVNDNPPSPYLDGRPPQVLDPQQHQALLQQHAALAAAQQQQQLGRGPLAGLANGLEASGGEPDTAAAAAAAAADAMQLDVQAHGEQQPQGPPPVSAAEAEAAASFIESALADEEAAPGAAGGSPPAPAGEAAAGAGGVPPTPEQQGDRQGVPGAPLGVQQDQQLALAAATAAAVLAGGDVAMASAEEPAMQAAAACEPGGDVVMAADQPS